MKLLVTGGNGYVGRALCRNLIGEHDVHVIDNLRYGENRFTEEESARFHLNVVDIRDRDAVQAVVDKVKPQVILHLAAIHYIPECDEDPPLAMTTNVQGTLNMALACPPDCRLVYASTGAVYEPLDTPHHETKSPINPADIYGYTKLHGEHYVRHLAGMRGFAAVMVRLFNVVGPGETNPHVLPEMVAQLKAGQKALKLGNITPKRDFIHVDDAGAGFTAAALNGEVKKGEVEVVNLGTSTPYSVAELIDMLGEARGAPVEVITDPARVRASDRPFMSADITRIRERFGWEPKHTMQQTMADTWAEPDLPRSLLEQYLPKAS